MGDNKKSARDVMTPNPDCVRSSDNVREAARIMKSSDTGVVPVVDGKKIIGLITDRDIVVRGLAEGKDLGNCRVNDVMTQPARTVREDTPVGEILDLMSGIVSIGDISTATNQDNKVGKAIEDISKAAPNN
jgi:CBS domain-containing protein